MPAALSCPPHLFERVGWDCVGKRSVMELACVLVDVDEATESCVKVYLLAID